MKSTFHAAVATVVLLVPLLATAQQQGSGLQRAQVRDELTSLERAGYTPGYPASLQAAQSRLASGADADTAQGSGYGPSAQGSSQAGRAANLSTSQSVYFGL
ncbi:DUF4148 domain-containing protein [Burkholderia sp. WSM2230]|uniref:DUF4148 domain-containing protein n=1 Tax=Burkholderia sp. WSM2230 TaxID=944435 RepID=UPI000419B2C2|nr:DUF4148 domain-containing protein [Burkholderia sp. WSM2230]